MRVVRPAGAAAFLAEAGELLLAREAEHNLILGLAERLRVDPHVYGAADPYLAVVEDGGRVVGAALRTPPHNLVLSEMDERVAVRLVDDVHERFPDLSGVLGPKRAAAAFVEAWRARTGAEACVAVAERIHRARTVGAPEGVPGRPRAYGEADGDVVAAWLDAFQDEALPAGTPREPGALLAERWLGRLDGGLLLWEDGEPVSVAGWGSPTPNGIRIGPVYTPPGLRRRGYATALVAALTARLLERHRFCFLFTDLANPTPNSIYAKVGYEPVADVDQWRFVYPPEKPSSAASTRIGSVARL